jgi:hypothetical protein
MTSMHRLLLAGVAETLRERALDARRSAQLAKAQQASDAESEFQSGLALAYYEVMSTLVHQALALGVPLSDLGLDGFDPDRELL